MNKLRLLFSSYLILIFGLFIYAFTQVDLSLTLSKSSIYQVIEKQLQFIGFFERPLSAGIFLSLAVLLFLFYFIFLNLAKKSLLKTKTVTILVFLTFIILVFSYNAFSYDLFNYIFDAKIVTVYHANPYLHRAADFAGDPMLNFMRWTQRVCPYGLSWLILTIPLSFIGLNIFLPTFFLFKIMIGLSFLGSCYLIYKISDNIFPKNKIFNTVFFAFNPLVIMEGLISSHNDMPMIFFGLLTIYLYLIRKKAYSLMSLLFSIGVKYSTGVMVVPFAYLIYSTKGKKKVSFEKFFIVSIALSLLTVLAATIRTTFQPWYLIFPLSLAAFASKKSYVFLPSVAASVFAVLIYLPYVLMTDYAKGYPQAIFLIEMVGLIVVLGCFLVSLLKLKLFPRIDRSI